MKKRLKIGGIFILLLLPIRCLAAQPLEVVINEIAWMGTTTSANDEWLELYNNTARKINLDGWQLKTQDNSPTIGLTGEIVPQGFLILERSDEDTLPTIKADLIYTGSLKNTGETLFLRDPDNNIIDQINCQDGWFAGDNQTKQTMERINSQARGDNSHNWQTSQNPGGTPKQDNSAGFIPPLKLAKETKTDKTLNLSPEKQNISNQQAKQIIETNQDQLLAGLNQNNFKDLSSEKFLIILLIALVFSSCCVLVILILKKKLKA